MDSKDSKYPIFCGVDYSLWKNKLMNYIKGTDFECWRIIVKGPIEINNVDVMGDITVKKEDDYDEEDFKKASKSFKAMFMLQRRISKKEFSCFSSCISAKEIWDSLELAYEGTSQVKKYRIDLLTQQYEMFYMQKDESINDMSARFSSITNELRNLGKKFETEDLVLKFLRSLTEKWQPKVTAIEEAKDLSLLLYESLLGSLMAHELQLNKRHNETTKSKGIALQANSSDDEGLDNGFGLLVKRFRKYANFKNKNFNKKPNAPKSKSSTKGCFKCGKTTHMIKDFPTWNKIKNKDKREKTKSDYKQAMLASMGWGDQGTGEKEEFEEEEEEANVCFNTNQRTPTLISIRPKDLCLMAEPNSDSDSDKEPEVSFSEIKDKFRKLSKDKILEYFGEMYESFAEQRSEMKEMSSEHKELHTQINDIAEENFLLKEKVKKLHSKKVVDSSNVSKRSFASSDESPTNVDRSKNDKNLDSTKVNPTSAEVNLTSPEVNLISDLQNKIKLLNEHVSSLVNKLTLQESNFTIIKSSFVKKISELQAELENSKDKPEEIVENCKNCKTLEREIEELNKQPKASKNCKNCENLTREKEELNEKFKETFNISKK
ncbi:hypothetical protein RND81_06G135800 [Saponaria officinalis]|uniref:Uncharacterized protein n=1 Tax=Saponaria officinalis TaxID=3572 RepID=A0AAW1KAT1_SAPOF